MSKTTAAKRIEAECAKLGLPCPPESHTRIRAAREATEAALKETAEALERAGL